MSVECQIPLNQKRIPHAQASLARRRRADDCCRLALDALEMAIGQRRPDGVIHHSDQGSQYTSLAFGKRCKEAGVRPSMGSVGDAYDNAMCESFFATLECELLERHRFASQAAAKIACFSFIEGWYNPARLHSALGYRSPMAYEHAIDVQPTGA
jgi:putative transposase